MPSPPRAPPSPLPAAPGAGSPSSSSSSLEVVAVTYAPPLPHARASCAAPAPPCAACHCAACGAPEAACACGAPEEGRRVAVVKREPGVEAGVALGVGAGADADADARHKEVCAKVDAGAHEVRKLRERVAALERMIARLLVRLGDDVDGDGDGDGDGAGCPEKRP